VGQYRDAGGTDHGFLLRTGRYRTLDPPGSTLTFVQGIDNAGQIVGQYDDAGGTSHGFLLCEGEYTTIDVPGSTLTSATGINASGQIVGNYADAGGIIHGYLLCEDDFTTLDVPGSTLTYVSKINSSDTDQRGLPRHDPPDIGAFEAQDRSGPSRSARLPLRSEGEALVGMQPLQLVSRLASETKPLHVAVDILFATDSTERPGVVVRRLPVIDVGLFSHTRGRAVASVPSTKEFDAMKTQRMMAAAALGLSLGLTVQAKVDYDFTTLDVPGAISSDAAGINDFGQIAGW
jgi:hypothetical protein